MTFLIIFFYAIGVLIGLAMLRKDRRCLLNALANIFKWWLQQFNAVAAAIETAIGHRPVPQLRRPAQMSSSEYNAMYGWGEYPERFWPQEIAKLRAEFATIKDDPSDEMTVQYFSDALDDMMGITRMESYR